MRSLAATLWIRRFAWIFIALGALSFAGGVHAGDRDRSRDRDRTHQYDKHEKRHHSRHYGARDRVHDHAHRHHRHARAHHHVTQHVHRKGWHYHSGRYWAPPSYRGRYCTDRRHYRGVHYHVAVRDYYDYYYPRYRYYGPHPHSGVASLIISVPLF